MADDQKNRAIANFLEPFESLPCDEQLEEHGLGDISDERAWILQEVKSAATGFYVPQLQPRDFAKDPECVLMLLDSLIPVLTVARQPVQLWRHCAGGDVHIDADRSNGSGFGCRKTLGEAIREAFGLAHHLWEKE